MNILLASSNQHKLQEFEDLFQESQFPVKIRPAQHALSVEETGKSYHENALIKAMSYYDAFFKDEKVPILSDDSGLEVLALPEELGIYSARFGGANLSDKERSLLLLHKMKNQAQREATFVCVLCIYFSPVEIYFFEGRLPGVIGQEMYGKEGFGYDPLFIPQGFHEGESLATLAGWKKKNSHRSLATQLSIKFLQQRVCQNK